MNGRRKPLFEKLEQRLHKSGSDLSQEYLHALSLTSMTKLQRQDADADEVSHVAALKLLTIEDFSSLPRDGQHKLATTVTKRTRVDLLRKQSALHSLRQDVARETSQTTAQTATDILMEREQEELAGDWLLKQDSRDRAILALRSDGLSTQQIAEQLDRPKSSVHHRLASLTDDFFATLSD